MEGFFARVQRLVPNPNDSITIWRETEMYRSETRLFGFDMASREGKLQLQLSNLTLITSFNAFFFFSYWVLFGNVQLEWI